MLAQSHAEIQRLNNLMTFITMFTVNDHYDTKACRPYQDDELYMTVSFVYRI